MRKKDIAKKKRNGKKGKNTPRLVIFLAGLTAVLIFVPMLIVWLFSPGRSSFEQKPLVFDEIDIDAPDILVWLKNEDRIITVELEAYIACVVSSEMPASFDMEALKAQAVAARTYSVARTLNFQPVENGTGHQNAALCNTTHCQVYKDKEQLALDKGPEWMQDFWPRIEAAVQETAGQVLCYNGSLAGQTLFHSSSGGRTENSEDVFVSAVPYLRSVESPYEDEATHSNEVTEISIAEFAATINDSITEANVSEEDVRGIQITARSSGDNALSVQIGDLIVTGREIRSLFNLSSANFNVSVLDDRLIFVSNGFGHGVGLSQYGAEGMAQRGYRYNEILTHYYTGVEIRTLRNIHKEDQKV